MILDPIEAVMVKGKSKKKAVGPMGPWTFLGKQPELGGALV